MLDSIAAYMDEARSNHRLKSDRALARLLELSQHSVFQWRTGKAFPSDVKMSRLAELAAADPSEALLLLNVWRAKDEPTRETYRRLLQRLGSGTAAALALAAAVALTMPSHADSAMERTANKVTVAGSDLYIMRFFRRLRGRVGLGRLADYRTFLKGLASPAHARSAGPQGGVSGACWPAARVA